MTKACLSNLKVDFRIVLMFVFFKWLNAVKLVLQFKLAACRPFFLLFVSFFFRRDALASCWVKVFQKKRQNCCPMEGFYKKMIFFFSFNLICFPLSPCNSKFLLLFFMHYKSSHYTQIMIPYIIWGFSIVKPIPA